MSYKIDDYSYLSRFLQMLNDDQISRLFSAKIIIFGVGGVGSALAHFLVRAGIQHLDIVDFDTIDISNLNRQLVAYRDNIGRLKVDALKEQLLNINPNLEISIYPTKLSQDTLASFHLHNYDIIVDCIDDVSAKKSLIKSASESNIYILSAMGAGNRYIGIPEFKIANIQKTEYDPLAKIIRKFCKDEGINRLEVCYTKQKAMKINCKNIASVVYYPINMASVMCARIINKIID